MNQVLIRSSRLAIVLCLLVPCAVISAQQLPGGGGGPGGPGGGAGAAAKCPDQLMFGHFGAYYYSVKQCPNTPLDMLYGYTEQIDTGCMAGDNTKCNTNQAVYAKIALQKSNGAGGNDPPGDLGPVQPVQVIPGDQVPAAVAANVESTINGSGSYKSVVRVASEFGADRYFIVVSFVYPNGDRANFAQELGASVAGAAVATIDLGGTQITHAGLLFPILSN